MLTFFARTSKLVATDGIARNLALIARQPEALATLQTVCTRLFIDWLGPQALRDAAPGHE